MEIDTEKLGIKTFVVNYEDGSKDVVKPVSWKKLDDIQILQYQLLQAGSSAGGSIGDILNPNNKDFWEPATKLAKLLPVVGNEEKGINLDRIENCEHLIEIFITATKDRDPETGFIIPGSEGILLPSLISRVNGINFLALLMRMEQEVLNKMKQ